MFHACELHTSLLPVGSALMQSGKVPFHGAAPDELVTWIKTAVLVQSNTPFPLHLQCSVLFHTLQLSLLGSGSHS